MPSKCQSDLLKCLQPNSYGHTDSSTQFDCKVLDGTVIVNCLPTVEASTFDEFVEVFIPHLQQPLHQSKRVDVAWDTYVPDSLKDATGEKRSQAVRRKVAGQTRLPKNWMMFPRDPDNKSELRSFLTSKMAQLQWPNDRTLYITSG